MSVTCAAAGETVSRPCLGGESCSFLPAHPEPAGTGSVPMAYVERLSDARTPLADFFRILLED